MKQKTLTLYVAFVFVIAATMNVRADEFPPSQSQRGTTPVEPIGMLPRLGNDWELTPDHKQAKVEAGLPFRWAVFQHRKTGDLLSIATHPGFGEHRSVEKLADTSLDIFPAGRAVWTQPEMGSRNVIAVKPRIARTRSHKEEVLEYCFISEARGRDNLMAHGRTWIGPKCVVFVQQTSAKPITSDSVQQLIESIIHSQNKLAASKGQH